MQADKALSTFRSRTRMTNSHQNPIRQEQISLPVIGEVSTTQAAIGAVVLLVVVFAATVGSDNGERVVFQ